MSRSITPRGSLDALRKEAKRWLRALASGDSDARRRFEGAHPHPPATPGLRDVQHALAREHGVESWTALKTALADLAIARRSHAERVADFLELGCLHYGVPPGTRASSDYPDSPTASWSSRRRAPAAWRTWPSS